MKKYKPQGTEMIKNLEKEIARIKLADQIIEARVKNGTDKIPYDIQTILAEIKKAEPMSEHGLYLIFVAYRDKDLKPTKERNDSKYRIELNEEEENLIYLEDELGVHDAYYRSEGKWYPVSQAVANEFLKEAKERDIPFLLDGVAHFQLATK